MGSLSSIYTPAPQLDAFILPPRPAMDLFELVTLLQFRWEYEISCLIIMVLGLLLSVMLLCHCHQSYQDAPATLPHFSLSHTIFFLKRRHDFFAWGFKVTNQRLFQFRLLRVCQTSVALMDLNFY
jgi:hypothetical protein